MKLLQKIEFWLFSVPALLVAIGGIAHYGAWRVLWAFPICFVLNSALRFGKRLPVELLDGPRIRACRSGKWPRAYALILPIALYDWFVSSFLVDFAGLLVAWRFREAMPGWMVALCVYAGSFAVPSLVRTVQGRCDGGYGEILIEAERLMLLAAIPLALLVEPTPLRFALYSLPFAVVGLLWIAIRWYKAERVRFDSIWEGEKAGRPWRQTGKLHWFPRPGVVYEPDQQLTGMLAAKVSRNDWEKGRCAFTVLSVSPVAFLSFALLVGGAAVLVDRWRGLVLFAGLSAFVLWFLHSAFIATEKLDTWKHTFASAAPHTFCYFWLGAMIAWFGTGDLVLLIATGAFLVGCFEFPTRFIVRASSERNADTLRFFATAGAVALAIWVRFDFGAEWYACGLCATVAAYPLVVARHFWPVKPLVLPNGAHTAQPGAVSGDPGKADRRERKRQRQMEAFRRSKRG